MAFRATASVFSKASRLPLTSKQANKDFYKGTGSLPGLGPKSQGRRPRSKAPFLKEPEKMRLFVAPDGWLNEAGQMAALHASPLKPYVFKGTSTQVPRDWPVASIGKPEEDFNSKRGGIYSPKGFDGPYYLQLAEQNRNKTPA